jgi:predicted Rossmann fold flavoprotein
MRFQVIVVGGGAAGLMCAIQAGQRGRTVLVIEHGDRLGRKILISGGGRCNFTNLHAGPENYLSSNPSFCKSALARYTPSDFITLVEKHGIAYHEKKLGQLFCDGSSRSIVGMLEQECRDARVETRLGCRVEKVTKNTCFQLVSNQGSLDCDSLVVASGGLSFPKLGASDFGYRLARQFGHNVVAPRPGLVPLVLPPEQQKAFGSLSGISLEAEASGRGARFRENILFTHRGLSGPAILQISNYCVPGESITLDLLPARNAQEWLCSQRDSNKELKTVLGQWLPQRFAQEWCGMVAPSRPMNQFSVAELAEIARRLRHWEVLPAETEGYAKAEVTMGGIDTREISSRNMMSRKVSGLYFVGEVMDVTGWLGGYNFQWAWSSGFAAGQHC